MKVLLSCHASREIGMGHFIRQLNMAEELRSQGHVITFALPSYKPALDLLIKRNIPYVESKKNPFVDTQKLELDIVVLDISNTDERDVKSIKKNGHKVVSFDDLGSGRDYVDLLIDSNKRKEELSKPKSLFGPEYIVLHNRFLEFRKLKKEIPEKIGRIVISMGGTDPNSIGPAVTKFLLEKGVDFNIDLILGGGFDDKSIMEEIRGLIEKNRIKCNVFKWLHCFSESLFNADLVICAGGETLYEACAVGTPALVISQVIHQQKRAALVEEWGAAIDLGLWKKSATEGLLQIINSLDRSKRGIMSIAGKKMVDAKGLKRVVNEIVEMGNNS